MNASCFQTPIFFLNNHYFNIDQMNRAYDFFFINQAALPYRQLCFGDGIKQIFHFGGRFFPPPSLTTGARYLGVHLVAVVGEVHLDVFAVDALEHVEDVSHQRRLRHLRCAPPKDTEQKKRKVVNI